MHQNKKVPDFSYVFKYICSVLSVSGIYRGSLAKIDTFTTSHALLATEADLAAGT